MTDKCSFEGCVNNLWRKDLCTGHYDQLRKGRPLKTLQVKIVNEGYTCYAPGCEEGAQVKRLCRYHLDQKRRGVEFHDRMDKQPAKGLMCTFEDCDRPMKAKGLCNTHYAQTKNGVDLRPIRVADGTWSKGHKNKQGYVVCFRTLPDGKSENRAQHRIVMEEHLGRELLKIETVHHINGVRDDNRIENLELWSSSQPYGQRVEDKADWAIEILKLYRPEALRRVA